MNPLRDAFRDAIVRLADRGLLHQASPWVLDLARRLSEVGP